MTKISTTRGKSLLKWSVLHAVWLMLPAEVTQAAAVESPNSNSPFRAQLDSKS